MIKGTVNVLEQSIKTCCPDRNGEISVKMEMDVEEFNGIDLQNLLNGKLRHIKIERVPYLEWASSTGHGEVSEEIDKQEFREKPKYNNNYPKVSKLILSNLATIIIWSDNTKTVVKCQIEDHYNPYFGIMECIYKKFITPKDERYQIKAYKSMAKLIKVSKKYYNKYIDNARRNDVMKKAFRYFGTTNIAPEMDKLIEKAIFQNKKVDKKQ